jgi:hypothetical protein
MKSLEYSFEAEMGCLLIKNIKSHQKAEYRPTDLVIGMSYSETNKYPVYITYNSPDLESPVSAGLTVNQVEDMIEVLTTMLNMAKRSPVEKKKENTFIGEYLKKNG